MSRKKTATMKKQLQPIPEGVTPIPARTAATILNCSMGHIRWLRRNGKLKGWAAGSRFAMLDLDEVQALAKAYEKARQEGRKTGAPSRGFSPDT